MVSRCNAWHRCALGYCRDAWHGCNMWHMPDFHIRSIDESLLRDCKVSAAREGLTLRDWAIRLLADACAPASRKSAPLPVIQHEPASMPSRLPRRPPAPMSSETPAIPKPLSIDGTPLAADGIGYTARTDRTCKHGFARCGACGVT